MDTTVTPILRKRLKDVLNGKKDIVDMECPMCHGTGHIGRYRAEYNQSDVAKEIGISRNAVSSFVREKQGLSLPTGLRLIEWLDKVDAERENGG